MLYVVLQGHTFGPRGEYKPGDTVDLTEGQAAPWLNLSLAPAQAKVEPVEPPPTKKKSKDAPVDAS